MAAAGGGAFLEYHEPNIVAILTLVSFFFFLAVADWAADKIARAGLIGQIVVGLIYGVPVGNILALEWQETFLALGYIGLILIIFEGGLTIRLDLLRQNFVLSIVAALFGVLTPIALSFALLYAGFGHGAIESFIVGTALCSTSLGTTFVVINSAAKDVDFSQTRVGTVLISAAILDDVCGLVLVSVIHQLRGLADGGGSLGWIIGRPILASGLMALLTPLIAKFILGPVFRRFFEAKFARFKHVSNILLMLFVLSAFLAIAAYAGASALFGSFLAGTVISSLPSRHPEGPFVVASREEGEALPEKSPTFLHTFEKYISDVQRYVLQPLFFASIGFSVPFLSMWTGEMVWKGVVFSILMAFGKLIVGVCVPIWDLIENTKQDNLIEKPLASVALANWAPATLLGSAMVARGEIGLLIIQIGLNETPYLSEKAFIIGIWAIVLNTIIGPVSVGILLGKVGTKIASDARWGTQLKDEGLDVNNPALSSNEMLGTVGLPPQPRDQER
ncbi:sodium-hydrogen antiporter [Podospora aff. communis PSN243]|uniref:Sodium-hydrogen antiporter n=1 Tax=Podospora aff. communis PSN243 TaxID=3040156 RepID=A0AAV9GCT0_9PEZI|nr:sodium-hydrogen antiporter [Podospora aff. communis PSN243]